MPDAPLSTPPGETPTSTSVSTPTRQIVALFRRSPPLWVVPALALLLVGALFPSSWLTELRPGFSHARAFVPIKLAAVWTGLGAILYWGLLIADRWGLGNGASLRFPDGVGEFDKKLVHMVCLACALLLTYGAPLWLLAR